MYHKVTLLKILCRRGLQETANVHRAMYNMLVNGNAGTGLFGLWATGRKVFKMTRVPRHEWYKYKVDCGDHIER